MRSTSDTLIDPNLVNSVVFSLLAFRYLIHIRSFPLSDTSVNRRHLWETDRHRIKMPTSPEDTIMDISTYPR